jgi:hypothetical protein
MLKQSFQNWISDQKFGTDDMIETIFPICLHFGIYDAERYSQVIPLSYLGYEEGTYFDTEHQGILGSLTVIVNVFTLSWTQSTYMMVEIDPAYVKLLSDHNVIDCRTFVDVDAHLLECKQQNKMRASQRWGPTHLIDFDTWFNVSSDPDRSICLTSVYRDDGYLSDESFTNLVRVQNHMYGYWHRKVRCDTMFFLMPTRCGKTQLAATDDDFIDIDDIVPPIRHNVKDTRRKEIRDLIPWDHVESVRQVSMSRWLYKNPFDKLVLARSIDIIPPRYRGNVIGSGKVALKTINEVNANPENWNAIAKANWHECDYQIFESYQTLHAYVTECWWRYIREKYSLTREKFNEDYSD